MTESTEQNRVWHSGPPPHVGWWQASFGKNHRVWRWWDGVQWSSAVSSAVEVESPRLKLAVATTIRPSSDGVEWNDYWPANARVPRLAPEDFEVGAHWVCVDPALLWEFHGLEFVISAMGDEVVAMDSYRGAILLKFNCLPSTRYVPRRCIGPQTRWDFPVAKGGRCG